MASEKNVILVFSQCEGSALSASTGPAVEKLLSKGALFTKVSSKGDTKTLAGAGAEQGESLWEAAGANGFVVGALGSACDMCVLDSGASPSDLEKTMESVMEAAARHTLLVVVAKGAMVFYGPGIAKGKVVDKEICVCAVAPTVAYVANFPVPAQCAAPVAYAAFKDINLKLNEIKKLNESITNMEAAIERKSRQPWDKHDCA